MKWLERNPQHYNRGIWLLTLGRLKKFHHFIAENSIRNGMRVLELGCGSGLLTEKLARCGAQVTAIDSSPAMLAEAQRRLDAENLGGRVTFELMDAAQIEDFFPQASFECIVASLMFSEIPTQQRSYLLKACRSRLTPDGVLLILDEVVPNGAFRKMLYYFVRGPLGLTTWLLTRTSTRPLNDLRATLERRGFAAHTVKSALGGSLLLFEAVPQLAGAAATYPPIIPRLSHRVTLGTTLLDFWGLFFRLIPPYPKTKTGLYTVGNPNAASPVLVTGNFDLTVRRLVRAIDGQLDAWVLVADSAGINVWCAAGGGYFTAEKVIAAIKASRLEEVVTHRALILPQLCANGVDGWKIRRQTSFGVHWGPVRADDLPGYLLKNRHKSDLMRHVRFPLKDRLEMVTVTLAFYGMLILLPIFFLWRELLIPVGAGLVGLSYFYAIVHPWLPGRDGLWKSIPLTFIALIGLWIYGSLVIPLPLPTLFRWAIGLTGLSVFTAAELQGMSPIMRGEQANWGWEAVIFGALGITYWLIPMMMGWQ